MVKIINIHAFEILDSRGNPTLKTSIELENGIRASASVPSGASTGKHEVCELRDNDERYHGKGVLNAVEHVNTSIAELLIGKEITDLRELDTMMIELDGTPNKSKLGANAILSVSFACMRAYAEAQQLPLWNAINEYYFDNNKASFPRLMVNIINGGVHANWNFDIQEFMISPQETKPNESVRIASEIFHSLEEILKQENYSILKGDEGGFSPLLDSNEQALSLINAAIEKAGYTRSNIDIGIDAAASEYYKNGLYELKKENKQLTNKQLIQYYRDLQHQYNIFSFEDPFAEDDWEGFKLMMQEKGDAIIVGDDLYTTNVKRIKKGITEDATSAVLIKPNQIGTLSETVDAIETARKGGLKIVISHRSGETEDSLIADLSYACGANFIKAGSMSRSERLAKYNRLIEIEEMEI